MQALVTLLIIPLMLLNFFGGIGSGIWLAILGEWWAIGWGIAALFFGTFAISLLMLPGLLLGSPAMVLTEKGKLIAALPFMALSLAYTFLVISAWCLFVFYYFLSRADADTFWPLLIWSYGTALGPLMYMAQKEGQSGSGVGASTTTFFAQIAYIAIAVVTVFAPVTVIGLAKIFGGVMLVGLLLQLALAIALMIEENRQRIRWGE